MTCSAWSMSVSRRELDVQQRARPVLALVADADDRAVGHVPDGPVGGAQPGRPQRDRLDRARDLPVEVDDVADAELVLGEDEDARQEVLDERLRPEAERHADDARAGEQRRDVHADLAQHHEAREQQDDEARDAAQDARQRAHALLGAQARRRRRLEQRRPARAGAPRPAARARCPLDTLRIPRSMTRPRSLLTISAPIAMSRIVSGVPMTKSAASASAGLSRALEDLPADRARVPAARVAQLGRRDVCEHEAHGSRR